MDPSHNTFNTLNFVGFIDNNSNNLHPSMGFSSSNINYTNDFPVMNNNISQPPCVNLPTTSSNYANISNNVASTSPYHPQHNVDQNPPPPHPAVENFPPLNFNFTIHSPQINLYEIFKFGFNITITPISPPVITANLDMQNQYQQSRTYYPSSNIRQTQFP
jgi:hypothetical protein